MTDRSHRMIAALEAEYRRRIDDRLPADDFDPIKLVAHFGSPTQAEVEIVTRHLRRRAAEAQAHADELREYVRQRQAAAG